MVKCDHILKVKFWVRLQNFGEILWTKMLSIVNNLAMNETQFTKKSFSNQAAFFGQGAQFVSPT